MDRISRQKTALHRLDPRAKVIVTACFLVILGSFNRLEVSSLLPLAVFPVALAAFGDVPFKVFLRKVLLGLPFILLLGAFLPVLDPVPVMRVATVEISGGWLAFGSLAVRGALAVATAVALVAVTGFGDACAALDQLGVPRIFVQQLLFLYRYLFVVGEETQHSLLARELRSHGRSMAWREYPSFTGNLLLRSWERAERIHAALLARGLSRHTAHKSLCGIWPIGLGLCFRMVVLLP
ncbi:MAG: cobalt ECF transporter T component CbiQ [Holophagaceae bacterium]|nr:cobalt ECF transporter T component CbiQ [Holophagaceae bacterium]